MPHDTTMRYVKHKGGSPNVEAIVGDYRTTRMPQHTKERSMKRGNSALKNGVNNPQRRQSTSKTTCVASILSIIVIANGWRLGNVFLSFCGGSSHGFICYSTLTKDNFSSVVIVAVRDSPSRVADLLLKETER